MKTIKCKINPWENQISLFLWQAYIIRFKHYTCDLCIRYEKKSKHICILINRVFRGETYWGWKGQRWECKLQWRKLILELPWRIVRKMDRARRSWCVKKMRLSSNLYIITHYNPCLSAATHFMFLSLYTHALSPPSYSIAFSNYFHFF